MGAHICGQRPSCTATTCIALGIDWLIRLGVVGSTVASLLQPVVVVIVSLLLTKIVECTTGSNHGWRKSEVKVASF